MKDKKARKDDNETRKMVNRLMDEVVEQGKQVERLEVKLADNRCISRQGWWNNSGSERVDLEELEKKFTALCEFVGVEWTVEPSKFVAIETEKD